MGLLTGDAATRIIVTGKPLILVVVPAANMMSLPQHAIFHHCRIALPEAFKIMYKVCNDPGISTYELSRQMELRQMTCWKLKNKLVECIREKGEIDLLFNGEIKD